MTTQLDSAMFFILIVLIIAFLAISVVAIHWIATNTGNIKKNSEKIDNKTKVDSRQDKNLHYLNGTIKLNK